MGKNKNKYLTYLAWFGFILAFLMLARYLYFHVEAELDADLASDLVFAEYVSEEKKSGSYRLVLFYRFESFKYTAGICSIILSDTELAYDKSGGNLTLPCAYDRILCMACIQFGSVLFSCAGSFVSVPAF